MARLKALLMTLVSLGLLSIFAGCGSGWHAPARTVDLEPPTDIEQARQQLAETNSVHVDSLEAASELAGYPVAMPAEVPQEIDTFNFRVFKLGPPSAAPPTVEFPYSVEQIFAGDASPSFGDGPFFYLAQSRNNIEGVGGESVDVDINGNAGKKSMLPAVGDRPARLGLDWSDGTLYYVMDGTLDGPLDEEALLRIAGSVRVP